MYGWTDPNDPDGAGRRPEPPTDEPAWLTDRPEPRSSYLFGDEPDQPADEWYRDQPTGRWEPAEQPTEQWQPADQPTGRWEAEPDGDEWSGAQPTQQWPAEPTGRSPEPTTGTESPFPAEPADLAAYRAATSGEQPAGEGRHRSPRRVSRPMLIGGAAAAATLVVSVGVGAITLTGGDAAGTDPNAVDDTIAAAPAVPGTEGAPTDALAPTTPSAAPTTAEPTPSPTKTSKPTPAPSRSTAASRRGTTRTSAPAATRTTNGSGVSAQAREVVAIVNAERAKAGCAAVSIDDKLMTAAQRHSQDQADHQDMSHTGSDGSDAGERLDRVGYEWRTYGENVAWNQKTPAEVMDAWMNSPGHRRNILNCAFTEIGVGVASSNGPYWTQVFAAPR